IEVFEDKSHIWDPHHFLFKTHRLFFIIMVRTKKTAKRGREQEIAMEEPSQDNPMA
ncbi:hypothetical protein PIB30_110465, partial [Stylosanthes scabra]|nr:hypothetical protein [Stylosanthes scabra]